VDDFFRNFLEGYDLGQRNRLDFWDNRERGVHQEFFFADAYSTTAFYRYSLDDVTCPPVVQIRLEFCHSTVFSHHPALFLAVDIIFRVIMSVRPSRLWVAPKRIKISSKFFHHLVAKPFWFFRTKQGGDVPTETPLMGASNARGVYKNDDFQPISRSIWETVIVRWAHSARQFVASNSLSIHITFTVIAPRASPGETKMW